jgi:hypothetical protein
MDFDDDLGVTWTVEIWNEGFAGTAAEMPQMGGNPFTTRWGGQGWKNIIGSETTLELLGDDDLTWIDQSNGRNIKVIIKRAGLQWWTGFALPDQFVDSLGDWPRYFTLTASDQLGIMDQVDYVDGSDLPYETWDDAINIIAKCLALSGLPQIILCAVNLWEDSMTMNFQDDPLKQTLLRQDRVVDDDLVPGTCYSIVDKILKSFQARLFQSAGKWMIIRVPEYVDDPLNYRTFASDGTVNSESHFHAADIIKVTDTTTFVLLADGSLKTAQPYKSVTINQDFDKRESIFRGWKFPENEFLTDTTFRHWVPNGTDWAKYQAGDDFGVIAQTLTAFDDTKYIMTEAVPVEQSTDQWKLIVKWGHFTGGGSITVRVVLHGVSAKYWYLNPGAPGIVPQWNDSGTLYSVSSKLPCPEATLESPGESELVMAATPEAGDIYVLFYCPYLPAPADHNHFFISEVKLQIVPGISTPYEESKQTVIQIDENNTLSLDDYRVDFSEIVEANNNFSVYRGVIKVGTAPADLWWKSGVGTKRTLAEWLQQWTDATTSYYIFDGSIFGATDYHIAIQLTEADDLVFLWEDVEFNARECLWTGTAIQLKGVLLDGETSSGETSRTSISSITGPSTVVPPSQTVNYHTDSVAIDSGPQTVTYATPYSAEDEIVLMKPIAGITADGETMWAIPTAEDENGFTISFEVAVTVYYSVIIKR